MAASAISMAATATATSSSSTSLHICNKTPTSLSFECSHISISKPFPSSRRPKPKLTLRIKTHFPNCPPFSLLFRPPSSAAYEDTQITDPPETEAELEEEEDNEDGGDDDDDDEEEEPIETQSADAGRLYVGNLPYSMSSPQLSEVFEEAGRVVSVEIVYDRVTDRSRGFAFVTMGSVEEGKEAIRMFNGAQLGGRTVKLNFPEVPRGGEREVMSPRIRSSNQSFVDSPHKIYAGNLSWSLTSQGLKDAFADQPGLLSAKVIYDRDTGRSRGFGFITFESAEEVQSALDAMNEVEVEGRPLRLNIATQRAPSTPTESDSGSSYDSSEILTGISS